MAVRSRRGEYRLPHPVAGRPPGGVAVPQTGRGGRRATGTAAPAAAACTVPSEQHSAAPARWDHEGDHHA
jgi:hypothetical protein